MRLRLYKKAYIGDLEDVLVDFYYRSLHGTEQAFSGFDWEGLLSDLRNPLVTKLNEHGLTNVEDYIQNFRDIYGDISEDIPDVYTMQTDYIYFTKENAEEAILVAQYNHAKGTFGRYPEYKELKELIAEIDKSSRYSLKGLISLVDRIVHAEHVTGNIFEDINVEDLKAQAEEMYNEEKGVV